MQQEKEEYEKPMDCITDQEKEFAQNAVAEFQKKNYGPSLQFINKLENRQTDFKVSHNKIVLEYYKSDMKKTDTFQKNLTSLLTQFRLRLDKLDDVDHCVAYYNQAVLYYHQRHYTQALQIMEKVYKFVEPIDESLAKQVGLLLVEIQFCTRQLDKAMNLLSCLENQIFNTNVFNVKQGEKLQRQIEREAKDKKTSAASDAALEEFKKKLVKYKARFFLMTHKLDPSKAELQKLFSQDKTYIGVDFLKANLEYLLGNYEDSQKILNNIPVNNLTYNDSGESALVMQNNNLGVVYHAMGKHNFACHYYQNALKEDMAYNQLSKDISDRPLYTLGASRYHELVYNLGIALLHAGRPANAFDCLIIAVRRYHRNSRLWLRLAECCIQVHKESNEVDFDIQKKQKEMIVDVIGSKTHKKILLTKNLSHDKKYSVEGQSYAVPVPTLEFGSLCLKNAYLLLPSDVAASPVSLLLMSGTGGATSTPPPNPGPAPSVPLSASCIASLKNAILAASAYVCLCLGDYILALEHAKKLLNQPHLSGAHTLLGHLYMAECLVLMDKVSEAIEHLNPKLIKDITLQLEDDPEVQAIKTNPPSVWFPSNLGSAHATIQYNLAVCKTLQGQLDQAAALLKQTWQGCTSVCKVPALIIMLVLYIELQLGHAEVARSLIKQYSLQHRIKS